MRCAFVAAVVAVLAFVLSGVLRKPLLGNRVMQGTVPWSLFNVNFKHDDIPGLSGKTVIVTGANVGLGKSTTKFFALKGATTIMTCRTPAKGQKARQEIVDELVKEGRISGADSARVMALLVPMELELSSLSSVRTFAEAFMGKFEGLDSLVLNAGIMHPPFGLTKDGIEQQWAVNHLSHFYLAKLLTPALQKAQPSTVVSVASNAQFISYAEGVRLTMQEINDETRYDPVKAYGQSKLSNVLFAQELAARFADSGDQIFVNSLNPGGVNTNLFREYPEFAQKLFRSILATFPDQFVFEPDTAALTSLYAATSPDIIQKKVTGTYFVPIADGTCDTSDFAHNVTLQKALWQLSEDVLKLKNF